MPPRRKSHFLHSNLAVHDKQARITMTTKRVVSRALEIYPISVTTIARREDAVWVTGLPPRIPARDVALFLIRARARSQSAVTLMRD